MTSAAASESDRKTPVRSAQPNLDFICCASLQSAISLLTAPEALHTRTEMPSGGCSEHRRDQGPEARGPLRLERWGSRGAWRPQPEWHRLAGALEDGAALGGAAGIPGREIVGVEHVLARLGAEDGDQVVQADEAPARLRSRIEAIPACSSDRKKFMPVQRNGGLPREGPVPQLR